MIRAYSGFHPENFHLSLFKGCMGRKSLEGWPKEPLLIPSARNNDKNQTLAKKLVSIVTVIMRYINQKLPFKNRTDQLITTCLFQVKVCFWEMVVSKIYLSIQKKVNLKKEDKNFLLGIVAFGFFSSGAHMTISTVVALSQSHKSLEPHLSQTQWEVFSYSVF